MGYLPKVDKTYLKNVLKKLLEIPSPTGYPVRINKYLREEIEKHPKLVSEETPKGVVTAIWEGDSTRIARGVTAHTDTLGAVVKEIKSNGRLKLTQVGGYPWNTIEGEGCTVLTNGKEMIRGSILIDRASHHVFGDKVSTRARNEDNLEVRLDIRSTSKSETESSGVEVGNFVFIDPRIEQVDQFIRSRHLDDKAAVACLLAAMKSLTDAQISPRQGTIFHFSNYEEVGHGGAAGFPDTLEYLLTVDMAVVGPGQTSDEFTSTLCVADSRGPYHFNFNQKLVSLANQYKIPYCLDVYPHYGSDGEAYWRGGGEAAVSLIGPGVDASHNYERTHMDSLVATTQWILAFLISSEIDLC